LATSITETTQAASATRVRNLGRMRAIWKNALVEPFFRSLGQVTDESCSWFSGNQYDFDSPTLLIECILL